MDQTIDTVIRDVARQCGISRTAASVLLEDAQIALENACDNKKELDSITLNQIKRMALDMASDGETRTHYSKLRSQA